MGGPIEATVCFGEVGVSPGQFSYPRAMDHDRDSLWVIDKQARVQRLDTKGTPLGGWRMPEWEHGKPTGVTAWEPEGADGPLVFAADTHYHRVMVFDGGSRSGDPRSVQGLLLTRFGENGTGPGQFVFPTDMAMLPTPDGKAIARLYVSEYEDNDRISIYEPVGGVPVSRESLLAAVAATGVDVHKRRILPRSPADDPPLAEAMLPSPFEFKSSFGKHGSSATADNIEFNRPQSMAIDLKRQELIVTDACNHRLGRFTLDGKLIGWISSPDEVGPEPGHFTYPYGLALMPDGTALVSEFGGNRLQHVNVLTGASLGIYGQPGHGDGQVASPWGVAVLGETVFILDSGNNRVIGFPAPRLRSAERGTRNLESRDVASALHSEFREPSSQGGHG